MLREVLTVGDKIDIKPLDKNGRPLRIARTFVSQLIDFVDFDVINIAAPIVYRKPIVLNAGSYYNLCFYANKGLYQCDCVVLSNHKENNLLVSVVRITSNLEKFQRREFYRLECIHDMEYRIISKEEEIIERKLQTNDFKDKEELDESKQKLSQFEKEYRKASIIDISGGGTRFSSGSLHNAGDKIRIRLDIVVGNKQKRMLLRADIIASERILNRNDIYDHRVEFSKITPKEQEDLIRFIFEQDRRLRRNDKER